MKSHVLHAALWWSILTFLLCGPPSLAAQESTVSSNVPETQSSQPCSSGTEAAPNTPAPATVLHQMPLIPPGPLGEVDKSFLDSYTAREDLVLAHQSPYVVVSGSDLILHRPDAAKPERVKVIPTSYHALKNIAHIPFTIYLLLSPVEKNLIPLDAQMPALKRLSACIDAAYSVVTSEFFSQDQIERQKTILRKSSDFLRSALDSKTVQRDTLLSFTKTLGPLMLWNAAEAGCIQINATHARMMEWKQNMSQQDWSNLMVVNLARHQARYRNAATQYFHWLIGDSGPRWSYPGESKRVIFAETLGPIDKASNELAIVEIDADASEAFFGDPWRLSEDILSEGAERCIKTLPLKDREYAQSSKKP